MYYPFSVESGSARHPADAQKITYTSIEANVAIPDSEFKMPEQPAKTAPLAAVGGFGTTSEPDFTGH